METVAIIQARMGSSRLRGKALMPVGGVPVLQRVVERIRMASLIDKIVVATTTCADDDLLAKQAGEYGVDVFRGSEHDVLDRFYFAARKYDAQRVIRVNADNPFIDPAYCDALVLDSRSNPADYVSYRVAGKPAMLTAVSFFAEAISADCLAVAHRELTEPRDREHVTRGIYTAPQRYHIRWLACPIECDDETLRFTLDTRQDLEFLDEVAWALGDAAARAGAAEIAAFVRKNPAWNARMKHANQANPKSNASAGK